MIKENQRRSRTDRTEDFAESLNSVESAFHNIMEYTKEAMLNLASAYLQSRGSDRVNVGYLIEEFGRVSDSLVVIDGILKYHLQPLVEAK